MFSSPKFYNKPSATIKCEEFLSQLRNRLATQENSVPWRWVFKRNMFMNVLTGVYNCTVIYSSSYFRSIDAYIKLPERNLVLGTLFKIPLTYF